MKTKYYSIKASVLDWIESSGKMYENIDADLIKKWANDFVKKFGMTDEQWCHKIGIFDVKDYKMKLPDDFKVICQVAYRLEKPEGCPERSYQITQWMANLGGEDEGCELEINLKCDKCHKTTCNCRTNAFEIDVDRLWEQAHPEIYYSHFTRIGRHGYGGSSSVYDPTFKLMKPKMDNFFNLEHHIPGCVNLNCPNCEVEYYIHDCMMEVTCKDAEILLSYMAYPMDSDGYLRVPEDFDLINGLSFYLDYKTSWAAYSETMDKDRERKFLNIFQIAEPRWKDYAGKARSALQIPDFMDFQAWLESVYHRRVKTPNNHNKLGRRSTDPYTTHGRLLGE